MFLKLNDVCFELYINSEKKKKNNYFFFFKKNFPKGKGKKEILHLLLSLFRRFRIPLNQCVKNFYYSETRRVIVSSTNKPDNVSRKGDRRRARTPNVCHFVANL